MTLTAKQEAFAQGVVSGLSQADAYRRSYDAKRMKPETVQQTACRLMTDRKVSARVAELRLKLETKGLWTRERSVLALSAIVDGGKAKPTEIVGAVKELNAMHGFLAPTKHEVDMNVAVNVHFD